MYYTLPKSPPFIYTYLNYSDISGSPPTTISHSLSYYLSNIKLLITDKEKQWDIYKKYTNPYEYIHSYIPNKKRAVSKYRPLSRSFFKMIELLSIFPIPNIEQPIKTFHLAEGPGGFIEAVVNLRNCQKDKYFGMTLQDTNDTDTNIPSWKKSDRFLREHQNVILENGITGTGDILSMDNFLFISEKYHSSIDLVTADGGFDFSSDFNHQEIFISKLLFAQISFALVMQKKGGNFILKIFDCFIQHTVDLLYLLSSFYEKVHIIKPQTSRYANSEKYIVCTGFLFSDSKSFFPYLKNVFSQMIENPNTNVLRFLSIEIPYIFIKKIEEYNTLYGQKQIQNIHYTLSLMENKHKGSKIDNMIQTNIQKSIQWCIKYNIDYNVIINNLFYTDEHV
uniref:Ribosomal RNA methyltransferase FtsJ domain-containing protein n=1 Tax=viral metagenome TaxID=1070528 RepID=A0A6C0I0S6_9ZZZZ